MTTLTRGPVWIKKERKKLKRKTDMSTTWSVSLDMKYKVGIPRKLLPLKSRGTAIVYLKKKHAFFDKGIYTAK